MRIFGLVSLVLMLSIVGLLIGKQTTGRKALTMPDAVAPDLGVRAQSRQMQSEVQHSLDAAMRAPRAIPDEP